jgi:hypothetical protein
VRIFGGVIGDNDTCTLNGVRFKVAEEIVFVAFIDRGNAVVAYKGLSEDKDLAFVRGIGHGFGVPNEGSGEDCFATDIAVCSERDTVKDRSIL